MLQEEGVRMRFAQAACSVETLPETRDWIANSPIVKSRRASGLPEPAPRHGSPDQAGSCCASMQPLKAVGGGVDLFCFC